LWYLNHAPTYEDFSVGFGFRADYNGVGLYFFKHENKWRCLSIYNQGLPGLTVEQAVNNLTSPENSCLMNDFDGGSLDIKYRVVDWGLQVDYSTDNGASWVQCIKNKTYVGYQ